MVKKQDVPVDTEYLLLSMLLKDRKCPNRAINVLQLNMLRKGGRMDFNGSKRVGGSR
jgi:hypothetical protein